MKFVKNNALYLAWAISLIAMLGSIYFSNVRNFIPCTLCWYQRIFMWPLVFILGVGILKKDKNLPHYVLPLALIGLGISFYHNLIYYQIIPEKLSPCVIGAPCTTKFIHLFGFLDIPQLSLLALLFLNIAMVIYIKSNESLED